MIVCSSSIPSFFPQRTLMQNNHKELWNLVDLVQTNFFGTKDEFSNFVANPIALGR
jgi:SNF2 family DNA or RNA helicase